jgi:hypothetical protein
MSLHIYGGIECLRFFPDNKSKNGGYAGIRFIKYDSPEYYELIQTMQYEGMGAFVTVNGTDGRGAKTENINRVRSFYVDIDGLVEKESTLLKLMNAKLQPSAIVETRNGLHAYWFAKKQTPVFKDLYTRVQIGLINAFNGDYSAKDLARVLRLPDTLHLKGEPFEVKVIHQLEKHQTPYYSYEQLLEAYPAPRQTKRAPVSITPSNESWRAILQDLNSWNPVNGERNMIMLLAAGVAIKYGISMEAYVDTMYDIVSNWDLGRDEKAELKRVAKWAYDKGNAISPQVLRSKGIPIRRGL